MNAPLDTLAIVRDLRKHGFTQEQAEAISDAVRQAAGLPDVSVLATKADIATLKNDIATLGATLDAKITNAVAALDAKITGAVATLDVKITEAKIDTLKWVVGVIVASVGINVGAMIALAKLLGH
jgi:hypothetical protein